MRDSALGGQEERVSGEGERIGCCTRCSYSIGTIHIRTYVHMWMTDTYISIYAGNCREVVLYVAEVLHEWWDKDSLIKVAV